MGAESEEVSCISDLTQQPKRRRSKNNFETMIETMTEISNKKIDVFLKSREDDSQIEIRHFFSSIGRTVEKFSLYDQAIAKKKILDIVTEIDLQRIAPTNPYNSTQQVPPLHPHPLPPPPPPTNDYYSTWSNIAYNAQQQPTTTPTYTSL